jgi:type I restriction enzyme, R subunit
LEKPKLTPAERETVKETARALLNKLAEEREKLFVADWEKDAYTRELVSQAIGRLLDGHLPESYGRAEFAEKKGLILSGLMERSVQVEAA